MQYKILGRFVISKFKKAYNNLLHLLPMEFKLTIGKMEDLKNMIMEDMAKTENIDIDDIEFEDIFYYSGLKKWNARIKFSKNGKNYRSSMDIMENGMITRYQQREENEFK